MLFMILDIVKKGEFAGNKSGDVSTVGEVQLSPRAPPQQNPRHECMCRKRKIKLMDY